MGNKQSKKSKTKRHWTKLKESTLGNINNIAKLNSYEFILANALHRSTTIRIYNTHTNQLNKFVKYGESQSVEFNNWYDQNQRHAELINILYVTCQNTLYLYIKKDFGEYQFILLNLNSRQFIIDETELPEQEAKIILNYKHEIHLFTQDKMDSRSDFDTNNRHYIYYIKSKKIQKIDSLPSKNPICTASIIPSSYTDYILLTQLGDGYFQNYQYVKEKHIKFWRYPLRMNYREKKEWKTKKAIKCESNNYAFQHSLLTNDYRYLFLIDHIGNIYYMNMQQCDNGHYYLQNSKNKAPISYNGISQYSSFFQSPRSDKYMISGGVNDVIVLYGYIRRECKECKKDMLPKDLMGVLCMFYVINKISTEEKLHCVSGDKHFVIPFSKLFAS